MEECIWDIPFYTIFILVINKMVEICSFYIMYTANEITKILILIRQCKKRSKYVITKYKK